MTGYFAQWGVVMRERMLFDNEVVSIKTLESLLQARIGWVDAAVSPFALAARQELLNRDRVVTLHPHRDPHPSKKELRLAG
jgi:hypothetical protein